jgi:hypothetical protein
VELGLFCGSAWYLMRMLVFGLSYSQFKKTKNELLRPIIFVFLLVQIPHFYCSVVLNHTASFLLWGAIGITFIPALERVGRK